MYLIRKQIVAQSLHRLREQQTHTLFAGYIYLQRLACQRRRLNDLQPEFLPFFKQFFFVGNHPLGAPYIKLFTEHKASTKNLWLNENVAGSYAPSSLRLGQPFRKVVDIVGKTYSLPPDHAKRAFEHLLYSTPIQVADLAIVLYRDFGLLDNSTRVQDIVDIFAYEFGYSDKEGAKPNEDFQKLYSFEKTQKWEDDWLEKNE